MQSYAPLFAAGLGDFVFIIIMVVVGIVWFLNQVFAKMNKVPPPRPGGRGAPGMPQPRRQPPQAIEDEIEAFLRRAAQARGGGAGGGGGGAGGGPRPAAQAQPAATRSPLSQPLSQSSTSQQAAPMPSSRRPPPLPASQVEIVPERTTSREGIGAHVTRHLDTRHMENRSFDERALHLTNLDQADEQMEAHIHQALDHQLGQFTQQESSTPGSTAAVPHLPSMAAAGLALFLASPQNLRNAFVLQEVLRRRDFDE